MKEITVNDFFEAKKKDLALSLITEPETLIVSHSRQLMYQLIYTNLP